jgi:hypothetical protein
MQEAVDTSVRALQRRLSELIPAGHDALVAEGAPVDMVGTSEPPKLISAEVLEDATVRVHRVSEPAETGFVAFLDGTQTSHVLCHADGVPVIVGTVAAVIRLRRDRRMTTWGHTTNTRVYAPLRLLSDQWRRPLEALPVSLSDTSMQEGAAVSEHPYAVRDAAIHFVQRERERVEEGLAVRWCDTMKEPLFVDGGISDIAQIVGASQVVGVVKSHRTLYAEGEALRTILRLERGERSSVFRISSRKRGTVASWYLRLRENTGRDPMWGLVRVEVAHRPDAALAVRADEVSRWVLAEASPLALPDSRWDKMVYGIRDCEEFLRAVS